MSQRVLFGVVFVMVLGVLTPPAPAGTFPPAGIDDFPDTTMRFEVEIFAPFGPGVDIWLPGSAVGPTVVQRGDPYPTGVGTETIDTEIIALDLTGHVGGIPITLQESQTLPTLGAIIDTDPDPLESFPAYSFFDVFFDITLMPTTDPVTWMTVYNLDLHPHLMEATIFEIPPDLAETPHYQPDNTETPLYFDHPQLGETHVGNLRNGVHEPEPATMLLLAAAAPFILKRRRRRA